MFFVCKASFVEHIGRNLDRGPRVTAILCSENSSARPAGISKLFIGKPNRQKKASVLCDVFSGPCISPVQGNRNQFIRSTNPERSVFLRDVQRTGRKVDSCAKQ